MTCLIKCFKDMHYTFFLPELILYMYCKIVVIYMNQGQMQKIHKIVARVNASVTSHLPIRKCF